MTSRHLGGGADAAASSPDGSTGGADSAPAEPTVIVFEDPEGSFVWECAWDWGNTGDGEPGMMLDLTTPADMQSGVGTTTAIGCFKYPGEDISTPGGIWFNGASGPDAPAPPFASLATGDPFVLESPVDDFYDVDVTPPLAKVAGDVVGPEDDWTGFEPGTTRAQVAHIQDAGDNSAESQVWFTSGIVGVRFPADDGTHYGFVELEFLPGGNTYASSWAAVRWGYRVEPDQPLTIPP